MLLKRSKEYRISPNNEDWVTPEETLLDSSSEFSDIERPISGSIFKLFLVIIILASVALMSVTFKIAIVDNAEFAQIAFQNKSANFPLKPPRGLILDRNGIALTKNTPIFNLLAITREIKENPDTLEDNLMRISGIIKESSSVFKEYITEEMSKNSTFFAHLDLTKEEALEIEYFNPEGFYVIPDTKREYVSGNKFSQVVGYIGKVSREDLEDDYYFPTDVIGRLGIEYQYEDYLRGDHGNIFFSREETGHITRNPATGDSLVLSIDHDLQIKLYDEVFAVLRDQRLSRAAGIIQNPKTGEILSMVSFPSFDNNIFTSGVSERDYVKLFENPARPLFNRAISGLYSPGSTIKPFIGMAGLQENVISPTDVINDCISITIQNPYDPDVSYTFRNWRNETGQFNLRKAIANSCNIFFYITGGGYEGTGGLGIQKIADYLKKARADSVLAVDLPGERKGFVPTPEWKLREKGEAWYLGDTYNTSIGQGDLLLTPLWLNSYISAIANGGDIMKPYVAHQVINENGEELKLFKPETVEALPFSDDVIKEMQRAMRETILSGTAQSLQQLPVEAAAKTGTAEVQKGRTTNSFFTAFAPYDDPQISMTVLIEGVSSQQQQGLAVRAAYQVLSWYFNR